MTTSATVASQLEIGLLENIAKAGEYDCRRTAENSETGLIPKTRRARNSEEISSFGTFDYIMVGAGTAAAGWCHSDETVRNFQRKNPSDRSQLRRLLEGEFSGPD
jgi:hypothetical protein